LIQSYFKNLNFFASFRDEEIKRDEKKDEKDYENYVKRF